MSDGRVLKLDLTSDPAELAKVRQVFRAWTAQHGWTEHQIADIVLALDEALSNVIRHAYDGEPNHKIEVRARALDDPVRGKGLEIRVRDFGKQVPLDKIHGRDLSDLRPGGLGVHIIRSVMASVEYFHAKGGGMRLVMRKYQRPSGCAPDSQAGKT